MHSEVNSDDECTFSGSCVEYFIHQATRLIVRCRRPLNYSDILQPSHSVGLVAAKKEPHQLIGSTSLERQEKKIHLFQCVGEYLGVHGTFTEYKMHEGKD